MLLPLELAGENPTARGSTSSSTKVGLGDRLHPPPARAVGRPAAARRDRPRAGLSADGDVRRRADGQPRLDHERERSSRCCATRWTASARRRSWSPTTRTRRPSPTACCSSPTARSSRTSGAQRRDDHRGDGRGAAHDGRRPQRASAGASSAPPSPRSPIVLGVAMIKGTYILTDTFQKAFDSIFSESYAETDAVVSGKQVLKVLLERSAPVAASVLDEVRALARGRGSGRRHLRHRVELEPGTARRPGRQEDRRKRRHAHVRRGARRRASPLLALEPHRGEVGTRSRPGRDRREHRPGRGVRRGRHRRRGRAGPVKQYEITGIAQVRSVDSIGGATSPSSTCRLRRPLPKQDQLRLHLGAAKRA